MINYQTTNEETLALYYIYIQEFKSLDSASTFYTFAEIILGNCKYFLTGSSAASPPNVAVAESARKLNGGGIPCKLFSKGYIYTCI